MRVLRSDLWKALTALTGAMNMKSLGKMTALAAVTIMLAAPWAGAAPVVKGDPKAYAEIKAAFDKFLHVKSYRMKGTLQDGVSMTMEVVPPDRYHTVMNMGGVVSESIAVGKEARVRQGGGPWQCLPEQESVVPKNPGEIKGEVTAAKGPVVAVDGVQTQSYTYSMIEEGVKSNYKLFVALTNGLPKRLQILDEKGAVTGTWDYFDYNAPITIALPPCT